MRLEPEFIRNLMFDRSPSTGYMTALLGSRERSGVRALFAFATICRDAVDRTGSRTEAQNSVALLTRLFNEGIVHRIADQHSIVAEVIDAVPDFGLAWEAWSFLEEDFEVPRIYAIEFIRGLKQDADGYRPENIEDLLSYVYRTGGVLGLVACHIFATRESAQQAAVDAASAARLSTLAHNVYKDFTMGRCFVPRDWMNYATTQTFAAAWADEAMRRFQKLASVLTTASRRGLAELPFRNRAAIAVIAVLHRESRSQLTRKIDRAADELIRQTSGAIWSTLEPLLRQIGASLRKLSFAIADVVEQRSFKPLIEDDFEPSAEPQTAASAEPRFVGLPERNLATTLRNQSVLMGRDV